MARDGYKTAKNTASGARSNKSPERYHTNYPQDWEKDPGAIQKTPYMSYEKPILNRNGVVVAKNISKLKQD